MSKRENTPSLSQLLKKPIHFLAFGFGSGLSPIAPGTAGTLMAIPLYVVMSFLTLNTYLVILGIVCVVGVYLCDKTSKDLGVHDHSGIVWDEFAGLFITLLPVGALAQFQVGSGNWADFNLVVAYGFVLFRFFDALKPWPISWFDKNVHGGLGIMLDDVIAGLVSFIVLQLTLEYIF